MADSKITQLNEMTAPLATDLLVSVDDPSGSPETQKMQIGTLLVDYPTQTVPAARVYNDANISHASSGSFQAVTFNSERWDTDTIHSTVANTSRLTCQTAGLYAIVGHVSFAANAAGVRKLGIYLNGTTYLAMTTILAPSAGTNNDMMVATQYNLSATHYVELMAYQNSGGALNMLVLANYSPEFAMCRIG